MKTQHATYFFFPPLTRFLSSSPDYAEGDPQVCVRRRHRNARGDGRGLSPGDGPDRRGRLRVQSDKKNCAPQRGRSERGETASTLSPDCTASVCLRKQLKASFVAG